MFPDGTVQAAQAQPPSRKRRAIALRDDDDKSDDDLETDPLPTFANPLPLQAHASSSSIISTTIPPWEVLFNQYIEARDVVDEKEGIVAWWGVSGLFACVQISR